MRGRRAGLEYCIITALPQGFALIGAVPVSVQTGHGDEGDVHNCVPVKLNNSIMLVFYQ